MKNRLFIVASVLFLAGVPTLVMAKSPDTAVVTSVNATPSPIISAEVLGTTTKKVEYLLPYPGVLLDNPLYFLKQLRDVILERLIVDPIRKVEFYILQADKFINMAVYLFDKGKTVLMGKAVQLAEKNISLAVSSATTLKTSGVAIPARVIDRLETATAKYVEVLEELLVKVDASQKEIITNALTNIKKLQGELSKLK